MFTSITSITSIFSQQRKSKYKTDFANAKSYEKLPVC